MDWFQIGILFLSTVGTIGIPLWRWSNGVDRRILRLEIEHQSHKTDITEMKETLASVDKQLGELIVQLKAKGHINGHHSD